MPKNKQQVVCTFDVKFTRRQFITKAALVLRVVVQLKVVDHQSVNGAVAHHLVLLPVRFDLFSVLLPRQLDVVFRHGARQGDVLSGQGVHVLQAVDELKRQSWITATHHYIIWRRSTVVDRWSSTGELSLSYA